MARWIDRPTAGRDEPRCAMVALAVSGYFGRPARKVRLTTMALVFVFLFGIANFALHKAVLESGHPLLATMPGWIAGRFSMGVEFMFLFVSLMLVARGQPGWVWGYGGYTAANGMSAWLMLTRRI